ncbi:GPI ethanolamine phosphate transferase 1 [Triticum urartu]|uniref:GPI ethanolamine phosphate transferase 1 n=1 Tax=Triticum urartu TaxID=4572 RepID=M7ZBW3_TRIUA|nr:GPI ethanolamine phosphate transferase 1 [Triticum urartu]
MDMFLQRHSACCNILVYWIQSLHCLIWYKDFLGSYQDFGVMCASGWKANPVEFDSVFNQSRHTISFGSPDIVPIFCSSLPHSTWGSYPHEYEDFATETLIADASFLDHWSFDQFEGLLNRSLDDVKLRQLLLQDKLVIFLHLLGCDSNGHAHRPYSSIYLNNVKVVDEIAERMYNLMESYFNDNRTAYVFTADHGMSDKGSHGDGHPSNTDTPLVAWGAGIRSPKFLAYTDKPDDGFRFVDDHRHDMPTPQNWALEGFERVDVNQADIAPLMATLVGLPCPLNSVGNLPSHYLKLSKSDEVEAVLANTKQILNQFLRKSEQKQSSSLYFKPFKPLVNYSSVLDRIEDLISARDYKTAMKYSEELRSMALAGLHYFQTYDWFMLMTTVTLGYIGWMANLILHVLQSYTTFPANLLKRTQVYPKNTSMKLMWSFTLFSSYLSWFQVMSFFDRKLYTWCFLALGILASVCGAFSIEASPAVAIYTWLACWFLSVFTLMPAEIPENNNLVIFSGALIILIAMASRWATINTTTFWLYLNRANKQAPKSSKLFFVQVILISVSSIMVWLTTSHRSQHKELHPLHQLINWCVAVFHGYGNVWIVAKVYLSKILAMTQKLVFVWMVADLLACQCTLKEKAGKDYKNIFPSNNSNFVLEKAEIAQFERGIHFEFDKCIASEVLCVRTYAIDLPIVDWRFEKDINVIWMQLDCIARPKGHIYSTKGLISNISQKI